jgi:hypothetical protein
MSEPDIITGLAGTVATMKATASRYDRLSWRRCRMKRRGK